jgi:predicted permease
LLVISEIGLALVMLTGAVLLIRSYVALRLVNPGFDAHNVLTMQMSLAATRFEKTDELSRLTNESARGIGALPGVEAASAACCRPLELVWQLPYIFEGRPLNERWHGFAGWTFISPQYFDVFRVPMLRGRAFTERDNAQAPGVVIINRALARLLAKTFTNGREPLHERLIIGRGMRPEYEKDAAREIVGIVSDIRDQALNRNPRPAMYVPIAQLPDGINLVNLRLLPIAWFVRTSVTPQSLSAPIQNELRKASGGLPVTGIRSMEEVQTRSLARHDFNMLLMSIFGGSALLLSAIGVYGHIAYTVEQRTQEIGVRVALGASSSHVRNMIIIQEMRLALIGVGLGIAAAYGLTRFLGSLLYGVEPRDPTTFVATPAILIAVALLACWIPARRAARINPSEALRYE